MTSAVLTTPAVTRAPQHREAVERVIAVMSRRLDERFSLEDLAAIAFFSPYHFHRVFRSVTGIPPGRFLSALRIEGAKRLLLTSDLSVTEICLAVGYQSLGTFTSQFSRFVGISPRRLRELARRGDLAGVEPPLAAPPSRRGALSAAAGRLELEGDGEGLAAVGLFPTPLAEGRPVGCTLAATPGMYELAADRTGSFYLLAVSITPSTGWTELLLQDGDVLVASSAEPVSVRPGRPARNVDLVLRPRRLTDPPILLSPALLAGAVKAVEEGVPTAA
jgi:AraC family transcriptional regulator